MFRPRRLFMVAAIAAGPQWIKRSMWLASFPLVEISALPKLRSSQERKLTSKYHCKFAKWTMNKSINHPRWNGNQLYFIIAVSWAYYIQVLRLHWGRFLCKRGPSTFSFRYLKSSRFFDNFIRFGVKINHFAGDTSRHNSCTVLNLRYFIRKQSIMTWNIPCSNVNPIDVRYSIIAHNSRWSQ